MVKSLFLSLVVITSLHVIFLNKALSQEFTPEYFIDSLKSVDQIIRENIDKFATPEYYQRKEVLRDAQRRGYANVLARVCQQDGLGGLIAYIKMKLHIEYSLNHAPIFFRTPMNKLEVLPFDWTFPEDPWKRDLR